MLSRRSSKFTLILAVLLLLSFVLLMLLPLGIIPLPVNTIDSPKANDLSSLIRQNQERLSFRPRPLDIHKKLPIVKSVKDFEDEDTTTSTRNSQMLRLAADADHEIHHVPSKKSVTEIPTPQFVVVDTYERDYASTFVQPTSYLRGRGARAEIGEFVEYDLDNEDEDWLHEFNNEKKILMPEKFESLIFRLEVLDHKTRERAGVITPTLGSPISILLQFDAALEVLQSQSIRYTVCQSVYSYWKAKRERWQKPILRQLQPPPPVNDTNPYNVFRPREKIHRLHTRRMQRRENNVQSFEKLRQVRRNLDQAKMLLEALIKREEKKREVMESEVSLQRIQMKYKHETHLIDDGFLLGFPPLSNALASSEDDYGDSDDMEISNPPSRGPAMQSLTFADSKSMMLPTGRIQELKQQTLPQAWLHKRDPHEPLLLFTRPPDPEKLAATGIVPSQSHTTDENGISGPLYRFHGRIGRGGRILFDRWKPFVRPSIGHDNASTLQPTSRPYA